MPQYALINVDFKWWQGRPYLLELGDAINASGYEGYNALYSEVAGDQIMLRQIIACLYRHFTNVYFIKNEQVESYWPSEQLKVTGYFDTIIDFIKFAEAKGQGSPALASSIILLGEKAGQNCARKAAEVQAWLQQQGIPIPVINGMGMIGAADHKFIFKKNFYRYTPNKLCWAITVCRASSLCFAKLC